MPKRGENIYKRKDGRWEGRYFKTNEHQNKQYGYVYAKTYREVKEKLAQVKERMQTEETCFIQKKETGFVNIAKEWLYVSEKKLKESSVVKYSNLLETYLLPYFQNCSMESITKEDIVIFTNELLETGGKKQIGLKPKSVMDILSVLKNIFEYAEQTKQCSFADIRHISVKQPLKPMRIFSLKEQEQLRNYLYTHLSECNLGILICMHTGLRIGEICALQWGDILFSEQVIYINKTMQRLQCRKIKSSEPHTKVMISSPKSECSIRKIPIPDELFKLITALRCRDDAYFLTGSPSKYIEPRTLQNRFQAILKTCNIDSANFHTLRHTFATYCVEIGFDLKSLSEILGHANINITMNRYVHPSIEFKKKYMNKFSELFAVKETVKIL